MAKEMKFPAPLKKKAPKEELSMTIMDMEFSQLPSVAKDLARFDLTTLQDIELKELCQKSRNYLRLLLDRAIARCEGGGGL